VDWVYDIPTSLFAVLVCVICLCIACGGQVLLRRLVQRDLLIRHNDVAGVVASLVGVIYAVLLSFVVIVVWQEYDAASTVAQKEASAVADLYHLSYGFPDNLGAHLRKDLAAYINTMLTDEWPMMQHGKSSEKAEILGHHVLRHIITFHPADGSTAQIRAQALSNVQAFFDARRDRLNENKTSLPQILWFTLIIGGIVTVGFTYFFGMESARLQVSMTAGLTIVIAMMFVLIVELDFPFRGDTRVQPQMWSDLAPEMASSLTENVYRP